MSSPRALQIAKAALLALAAWLVVSFAYVVVQRFRYPVEIEWMGGAILDHVDRVKRGDGLYVEPSAVFIPYVYTPLYYWVSALIARAMPTLIACRVVSLAATIANAVLIYKLARSMDARRFWAAIGVGLFFGAYSITGFWYDTERCDTLAVTFFLAAAFVWIRAKGDLGVFVCGAIFGVAFLAKQLAASYIVWPLVALAMTRQWKPLTRFGAGAALGLVPTAILSWENPWFFYYCLKMPSRHGVDLDLLTGLLTEDFGHGFLLIAATLIALGAWSTAVWRGRRGEADARWIGAGAILFSALVSSASSKLHVGGWVNVLMGWSSFACVAAALVLEHAERALDRAKIHGPGTLALIVVCAAQLMHLAYDPKVPCPDERRVLDAQLFVDHVRTWEKGGDVIVPGRGNVTQNPHFHAMALMDILRGGLPLPNDFVSAIENRTYAAYVVDEMGELTLEPIIGHRSELFALLERNYFIAAKLDDRERPPVIGWIAHPTWVFRPRRAPLGALDDVKLERRMRIEMGLAELRLREVQAGARAVSATDEGRDIEDLAAEIDANDPSPR